MSAALTIALLFASPAAAQPHDGDEEARHLFEAGTAAYADGRYEDALDAFSRAYDRSPRPELLYNIGQANDRLRRDQDALDAFERFLEALPDHHNAPAVRARMEVLTSQITESRREEQHRKELAAELAASRGPGAVPWVVVIAGGAIAAGGGVLLGIALTDKAAVENASIGEPWTDLRGRHDRVGPFSTIGLVMIGVGGAAALAGLGWAIAGAGSSDAAAVVLGPTQVGVRGRF